MIRYLLTPTISLLGALAVAAPTTESLAAMRPAAVPLVVCDPYFSVWSCKDKLYDEFPKHWTGSTHALCSLVRVDDKSYRLMGTMPKTLPHLEQKSVEVLPTRTLYRFEGAGVRVDLTFMTPLLPDDLDVLSRPLTYLTWDVSSTDEKQHEVTLYFDASSELAVTSSEQEVEWTRLKVSDMDVLRLGTHDQPMLKKSGDNLRVDWGYLYLGAPKDAQTDTVSAGHDVRTSFCESGTLPGSDDLRMPRAVRDDYPVLACAMKLGQIGQTTVSRHLMLAYDDIYSIEYLQRRLRPYWRRTGMDAAQLLVKGKADYETLRARCEAFDQELLGDLRKTGGEAYARLASLAYRQCIGAHKLCADFDGKPMFFSKECFSNGCIDTVDITYPSAPFFLLLSPQLLKAQLTPLLDYANSPRWKHPFAPHDLGTYPLANGQVYGGGEYTEENQMPVEESGNLLLLIAALAQVEGNANYASAYWPMLEKWAAYLRDKGLDPESQLCTDDFAGHLAHNTNLSLKAILALGAFSKLCDQVGKKELGASYRSQAEQMAATWAKQADDGDHYRLAFDKPGTWSLKYNLVWDKLLGLELFPKEIAQKEIAYYKGQQNRFGLPLDNRSTYTKLDWVVWAASLAGSPEEFQSFIRPLYDFVCHTADRTPLTDWFWTKEAKQVNFQARSVVGGIYIPLLFDEGLWKKWSERAQAKP